MALPEYRVQLTDPTTQQPVTDVDVLTNASAVTYENAKATVSDFRGIKKGTTFPANGDASTRLTTILDNLLYPHIEPKVVEFNMGLLTDITEDEEELIEFNDWKDQFHAYVMIEVGSESSLTLNVVRRDVATGVVSRDTTVVSVVPGSAYIFQPAIAKIDKDTIISITIDDGISVVETPSVKYSIKLPVFVGLCDTTDLYDNEGNPDQDKIESYFQTLIRNSNGLVSKSLCKATNVHGIMTSNPTYDTVRKHPFILYPNTWNKLYSITDSNKDNIGAAYWYQNPVFIKPNSKGNSECAYTVYICKYDYYCNNPALADISYNFDSEHKDEVSLVDHVTNGAPSISGFDVLANIPSDWRTLVDTIEDRDTMLYPYDGLITYVKAEHSFFRYNSNGEWVPTNQQVYITSTGKTPDLDLGAWNDICIDLKSNIFYQKHQNIRWEEKGRIIGGSLILKYSDTTVYKTDDLVLYDNVVYKALKDNIVGITPGTDTSAWEVTDAAGGIPGPVGPAGDAATIEIVGTEVVDDVKDVTVVNLGDKQNARLLFKVPGGEAVRGPKGDTGATGAQGPAGTDGRAATITLGNVTPGNRFSITNVGTINDAILDFTYPEALDFFNNGGTLYPTGSIFQSIDPDFNPNGNLPGHWEYVGTSVATSETGSTISIRVFKNVGGDN